MSAMPPTAPRVIYARGFDLEPGSFQAESGILPISPISANLPGAFIPRILGVPEDSGDRERELLKLMSSALVDDLRSAGLNARFLPSGELYPSEGWLVRGVFVQVDESNRLVVEQRGSESSCGLATLGMVLRDHSVRWIPVLTAVGSLVRRCHSIHM